MLFQKPRALREGDTVAVLSPSWAGPSIFPGVFDLGLRNIENLLGLKIKEYPTARMSHEESYLNPKLRAKDINDAFADPEVSAIFASIGGDDSVRILPFLDLVTILANPKIIMGFSDSAAFLSYLNTKGMVTFNGPSILAGFAQLHHLPDTFAAHIRHVLMDSPSTLTYEPYEVWVNNYVDWKTPGYDGETGPKMPQDGWRFLQGSVKVQGRLFGGCIEVLEFLKGTPFWPSLDFFDDKILFFETSEDKPTVDSVKYMLRNYGSMGVIDRASGILFGRARSYTLEEKAALDEMVVRICSVEFGRSDLPIVTNMDFGHNDPQLIMPLGVMAEIDCDGKSVSLVEPATIPV